MYVLMFLAMARKMNYVYFFMCCLLLTSMAESASLKGCLRACQRGTSAIQAFCRRIPKFLKHVRAVCWAHQFAGPTLCKGFCYAYF